LTHDTTPFPFCSKRYPPLILKEYGFKRKACLSPSPWIKEGVWEGLNQNNSLIELISLDDRSQTGEARETKVLDFSSAL
jgi:hypothetical protein